ncbi:MAG: creatininase family protein [Peptostreptococcaceae bacterium]
MLPVERKNLWWDEFSKDEILAKVKEDDIAILPIGAIEQHGPHCPCGSDIYNAMGICEKIAEKTGVMLLPALPYGSHPYHHWGMAGTIPLRYETHTEVLCDIIRGAAVAGYKKFLIISAHGQVSSTLVAVHKLGLEGYFTLSMHWYDFLRDNQDVLDTPMTHADEAETSVALYLYPKYVDMSKAIDDGGESLINKDFQILPGMTPKAGQMYHFEGTFARPEYKELVSGVIGYPTLATVEKGEKIVTRLVDHVSLIIEDIRKRYPAGVQPPVK